MSESMPIIEELVNLGAVRCSRCLGVRHPVGNCELCGYGPAPSRGAIPASKAEEGAALSRLLDQLTHQKGAKK